MKVETSAMPQQPYEIIIKGDTAYINFYENAQEIPSEEQPRWICDNLEASIQSNFDAWLNMAKSNEPFAPEPPTLEKRVSDVESTTETIINILAGVMEV